MLYHIVRVISDTNQQGYGVSVVTYRPSFTVLLGASVVLGRLGNEYTADFRMKPLSPTIFINH